MRTRVSAGAPGFHRRRQSHEANNHNPSPAPQSGAVSGYSGLRNSRPRLVCPWSAIQSEQFRCQIPVGSSRSSSPAPLLLQDDASADVATSVVLLSKAFAAADEKIELRLMTGEGTDCS